MPEFRDGSALTENEREIVRTVVDTYLGQRESTSRKRLLKRFQEPSALDRLSRYGLLKTTNNEQYLPTALAFHYYGDELAERLARTSVQVVLDILKEIFLGEEDKESDFYTPSQIESRARKINQEIDPDVRLGLYLAEEFGVLGLLRKDAQGIEIASLRPSERILEIKDTAAAWDQHIRQRSEYLERQRTPDRRHALLQTLYQLANGREGIGIPPSQWVQAATEAGFHHDEWSQLMRHFLGEGLIRQKPTSEVVTLTHEGLLAAEADAGLTLPNVGAGVENAVSLRTVFLVHGRNEAVKETVARFLEKLGLRVVILHEQPNKGRTVIEKFEEHSEVSFAVVLLTGDDSGGLASEPDKWTKRARQNVILELGYFIGKLGRRRVCAIRMEGVEIPSDIHGVVYVPYDDGGGWRLELVKEIKAAGIDVDMNLVA